MADEKRRPIIVATDPDALRMLKEQEDAMAKAEAEGKTSRPVSFTILDELKKHEAYNDDKDRQVRMAFEVDPDSSLIYQTIYEHKVYLLPDPLIKKIHRTDDLIAAVLNARGNHLAAFGRPRANRFDTGFDIIVKDKQKAEEMSEEQREGLAEKIREVKETLFRCGSDQGWSDNKKLNLSQFLKMFTVDGLRFGRGAVEIIYEKGDPTKFHSFRNVDAGTIYKIAPYAKRGADPNKINEQSAKLLTSLKDKGEADIVLAKLKEALENKEDEFTWIQVINGTPRWAFKNSQLVVHNFYPVTDVEYNGYPLTPLDTIITAVTTHINIGQHEKAYFQSGRASRGALVIQSDSLDEGTLQKIRMQFQASINSVQNAFRMPVFGVGTDDAVNWIPIDGGQNRDKEFGMLADSNARTILSAFQMSPDELPGYAHLSRASNQQSLSESDNEYKLEAARDVGLRPLLMTVQDFFNERIFPLIDKELSEMCCIAFQGLDAENPEKEVQRLQLGMTTHLSMNDILEAVDKKKIPPEFGGDLILNSTFMQVLEKYKTHGEILEEFFGVSGASQKPELAFYNNNPAWFQYQQIMLQQAQMQAQAEAQKMAMEQADKHHTETLENGKDEGGPPQEGGPPKDGEQAPDFTNSLDQLMGLLGKSEKQLGPSRRRLLAQHRAIVSKVMSQLETDSEQVLKDILEEAKKHSKKG